MHVYIYKDINTFIYNAVYTQRDIHTKTYAFIYVCMHTHYSSVCISKIKWKQPKCPIGE